MKRIRRLIFILIGLIGGFIFMSGCMRSKEDFIREYLKQKYNEEFLIHSISTEGVVYKALCSPVDVPDVVFEIRIENDGTPDETDNYLNKYAAKLINDILTQDLHPFFVDAYFHSDVYLASGNPIVDIKGKSLEEVMKTVDIDKSDMFLYIYYDKKKGTEKKYVEEYNYFTSEIENYIKHKKMLPITVVIYKVDSESIENLEKFYQTKDDWSINHYYKEIFGIDNYSLGNMKEGDLGNPPNITVCFKKEKPSYIKDIDEYIQIREMIENE